VTYRPFSREESTTHELGEGYVLQSAPERLFGISYALYRNANPEFDEFLDYGADLQGLNYSFWVLRHRQRIGGIVIRPNHLEGLFVRPPQHDNYELLGRVMPILLHWSDRARPVEAVNVLPDELELYQRLGFRMAAGRRVYIRPTEPLSVQWDKGYQTTVPTPGHVSEVAALFHIGYRDYPPECDLGRYSEEQWAGRVQTRLQAQDLPEACRAASTLVHDSAGKLVGACLVGVSRSIVRPEVRYAKVLDISVHPAHRRRGLAARMLQKALGELHGHFPVLKFGVALGNPAEALYFSQGFLPSPAEYRLLLPA
jgi:GNAT superfamily N-acetyltransferase